MLTAGPAATPDVREHNRALVLADIRAHTPTSRGEAAARTGLARGSLTTIVPELVEMGLVREETAPATGVGRPRTTLELDGTGFAILCTEVRADGIVLESVDLAGRSLRGASEARPRSTSPGDLASTIAALVMAELERLAEVQAVCAALTIVMPAPLFGDRPVVMMSTDFGWDDAVDLISLVAGLVDLPAERIRIVNDAAMAGVAEYRALRRTSGEPLTLFYLKADTGVGGALISDGEVFRGGKGLGVEPGHVCIRPGGRSCACGRRGCLVAEAGPDAMLRMAGLDGRAEEIGLAGAVDEMFERVAADEPEARTALSSVCRDLRSFTNDIALLFDPDQIVLGGFWARALELFAEDFAWDMYVPPLLAGSRERAPAGAFVAAARLGDRSARLGAIDYTLQLLSGRPSRLGELRRAD